MVLHQADVESILRRRHDNGADFWASPDGRIYVGNPFSTLSSLSMLYELGVPADHEVAAGGLELVLDACREDGRIRVGPKSPMYPCYTAEAARVLCRFGFEDHPALQRTVQYLIDEAHELGGWRCNFTRFGKGPETRFANPGATLFVLDVLRFFPESIDHPSVLRAVESLLSHWETRAPIGPCHYGIGTRFLKIEFPFWRYSLFYYLYILSFYSKAKADPRFDQALRELQSRVGDEGQIVVEETHRNLGSLEFCAKGRVSTIATERYSELCRNALPQGGG